MTDMATPRHKNPCPWGYEIYNFSRPFFSHDYYTLILYGPCNGVEKKIFLRNASILYFLPQNNLPLGWGDHNKFYIKFTISCLFTLQMLHTKDWPSVGR